MRIGIVGAGVAGQAEVGHHEVDRDVDIARVGLPGDPFDEGVGHDLASAAGIAGVLKVVAQFDTGDKYGIGMKLGNEALKKVSDGSINQAKADGRDRVRVAGGTDLDTAIDRILAAFPSRPHIFNLGHGIVPDTPIAHVEHLINRVRG